MEWADHDNLDTISIDTLVLEEHIQEERSKEIEELNCLSKKVNHLHTSFLYYRMNTELGAACYEVWRTLVRKVGGSLDCWYALGHYLGLNPVDLDYIKHSIKEDPTDVILKLFLQDDKATIDKIVDAFVRLQRYDILKALQNPLRDLAACFGKENNKSDTGYESLSKNSGQRQIYSYTNHSAYELPPALNKRIVLGKKDPNRPKDQYKLEFQNLDSVQSDLKILFLTFTEDGFETALNIAAKVNKWNEESSEFKVCLISLNDRRTEVMPNPEKFIREYFEKAELIVPIITSGYLNEIQSHSAIAPSTSDNFDYKYVGFIYNLIVNNYIHAMGCYNKKVRSVLPLNADAELLASITMYPDLMPWTHESYFDEHFKVFLNWNEKYSLNDVNENTS